MDQRWFEMADIRRRKLAGAVWIPLRASQHLEEVGRFGYEGHKSEFLGVGTLAVPVKNKVEAETLGWMEVGLRHNHCGYIQDGEYIAADVYRDNDGRFSGVHLVLDQRGTSLEHSEWHLHQDLVIALGLKREADVWVRPDEGYVEVAKLHRNADGSPCLLEIRASHLRDYLCARDMALLVASYRDRVEVFRDPPHLSWPENPLQVIEGNDRWEGRIDEIHEGGMPHGEKVAVFHVARTDPVADEDVPTLGLPSDDNTTFDSWTRGHTGEKLFRVEGELWRTEWIEPASASPIVRGDETPPTVYFITDAEGRQENKETLAEGGRWLWFRPEVMPALAHRRGGALEWYTRDTGNVRCSPDYGVHFGVNPLGLINVYAKDIVLLPEWQQRIWAGYNVSPDGRVCEELLAAQVAAEPANTQAPEAFLGVGLLRLKEVAERELGKVIIREHDQIQDLLARAHRFRSTDQEGLFALAKDLARLTADSIDASALQEIVSPPKGTKWGSLKSLENVLASRIDPTRARSLLSPLVGIYELRHADAHLASKDSADALDLVLVDRSAPYVVQGYQMLHACVSAIFGICKVIETWGSGEA